MRFSFRRVTCDVCGADAPQGLGRPQISEKILAIAQVPEDIYVVRCRHCGFYYTNPMPFFDLEALESMYDAEYFPAVTRWWENVRRYQNPRRRLGFIEHYSPRSITNFLEVGCGPGYGMEEALRRGWWAYGQDVSTALANQARERIGGSVFIGELTEARYDDDFFDAIYMDSVLEHVPRPTEMLREIHRISRPRGILFLVAPNEDALFNQVYSVLSALRPSRAFTRISPLYSPFHVVGFTKCTLRLALEKCGFHVKHTRAYSGTNEWRKSKMQGVVQAAKTGLKYPVYLAGELTGRGTTLEVISVARK